MDLLKSRNHPTKRAISAGPAFGRPGQNRDCARRSSAAGPAGFSAASPCSSCNLRSWLRIGDFAVVLKSRAVVKDLDRKQAVSKAGELLSKPADSTSIDLFETLGKSLIE